MEKIVLGGGCFWCTEAIFRRLKGVKEVTSGYANSNKENPSYEEVCSEATDAAESILITYDPKVILLDRILEVYWHTHNPTTLNKQGNDYGRQYRSAIFYENENQREAAQKSKEKIEEEKLYPNPIVTEITPLKNFYPAEDYHKDYYDKNRSKNPYCTFVIDPKIQKLLKEFSADVKEEYR